ncbi:HAD family hydrolase [Metasolibacillus meyeri]|uniref:HAD family hydrolase n=1 Tax=Metasolibacillus meyeri TaxID=1071052 RepID=UPI000D302237|nr:HAD family hydrolase [Metasolibacillus meyeri]
MKAIIFDFDGTLANTLPICFYAFQSVFKQFDDKDLTSEDIVKMFGPSETGIIRENLQNPNKAEAIELYYEKYAESHTQFVKPNDEITELLYDLKDSGMKLAIFTGKARRSLDISLQALQMDGLFDVIITGDDVVEPKPAPEGLFKALALLEVDYTEAIFVGDSEADIVAGLQANVQTVGVHWLPDYQTAAFMQAPHHIVEHVAQFKDLIGEMK